jgi:hypothetical protein
MSNARLLRVVSTPQSGESVLILALVVPAQQTMLVLQSWPASQIAGFEPSDVVDEIEKVAQAECDQLQEASTFSVAWVQGVERKIECSFRCQPRAPEEQVIYPANMMGAFAQMLVHKERTDREQHLAFLTAMNALKDSARDAQRQQNLVTEQLIKLITHVTVAGTTAPSDVEPDVWQQAKAVVLDKVTDALIQAGAPALPDLIRSVASSIAVPKKPAALAAASAEPPNSAPNGVTAPAKHAKPGAGAKPQ